MSYQLKDLIADVAKKRGPLNQGGNAIAEYTEVWDAFNRYASACFNDKRGLSATNFCKIGWVIERRRHGGKNVLKPYWSVAESFCKGFGIENPKGPGVSEKDFCPFEELNFSKAAIRYSNKLTKDQMFSGLRYCVQGLGEAISKGRDVKLDFEMGRMLVQERKPRFCFDAKVYAKNGIEAPGDALQDHDYKPSVTFAPPSADAYSLSIAGEAPKPKAAPSPQKQEAVAAPPADWEYRQESGADVLGDPEYGKGMAPPRHDHERDDASTMSGTMSMVSETDDAGNKQHFAYKEALDRHITEMEIRASEAVKEREQWENHISRCLQQEKEDFDKKRMLNMENQDYIHQQMRWNEEARHDQRRHLVDIASAHDFPHFSEPPEAQLREVLKDQASKFRGDLDFQVRTNNALRDMARAKERELENSQLDANKNEMAQIRSAERNRKEADKHALTNSWNQEIRMKGIWKAIENHTNAAAHSVPLEGGGQLDQRSQLRSSSGSSVRSNRSMPGGASRSLASRKAALQKAGGASLK